MTIRPIFDTTILNDEDYERALIILRLNPGKAVGNKRSRDLILFPDATIFDATGIVPYLYRWHIVPRNAFGNVYFHIQVADDPDERGPHDHSYDSQSTLLAGAYWDDTFTTRGFTKGRGLFLESSDFYKKGDMVNRIANTPHRLRLAEGVPYTMTLFCTGPRYRPWGFYDPDGTWHAADENSDIVNGIAAGRNKT